MNIPFAIREPQPPLPGTGVLARLKTLITAATDRSATVQPPVRPYSFLSECECPDDCFRDHENE